VAPFPTRARARAVALTLATVALVLAVAALAPARCGAAPHSLFVLAPAHGLPIAGQAADFFGGATTPATGRMAARLGAGHRGGHLPSPVSLPSDGGVRFASVVQRFPSTYVTPAVRAALVGGTVPASFNLRTAGKLPPVENQGVFGTCWAFAALGSLESTLLPAETWDFSENNLVNLSGFLPGYNGGGNKLMATAYLVRWSGPVLQSDDPYVAFAYTPNPSPLGLPVQKHMQEVLYIPPRSGPLDNANLKWAVMTYGAVDTSMDWEDASYNELTSSYYDATGTDLNHDVDLVGWDDNYPASNFASRPKGNGAFLARNSWGTGFGEAGYFWVSYYDRAYATDNAVFDGAQATTNYSEVYQYDPLGWVRSLRPASATDYTTAWFANAFTADASDSLAAVGFYTAAPNSSYEVRVTWAIGDLTSVTPIATGTIAVPGYHTIALNTQYALRAGQPFVVAVKLTTPGWQFPVAVEAPYRGYAAPTAQSGQSYVSADGQTWSDLTTSLPNANVCLKAYATDDAAATPAPVPTPAPSPTSVATPQVHLRPVSVARGHTANVRFSVSHHGRAAGRVRLVIAVMNRSGRVVRHATLTRVTLNATHCWRFRCSLARGTYTLRAVATDAEGLRSPPATARLLVRGRGLR
jgi:C1A family cysteine protease